VQPIIDSAAAAGTPLAAFIVPDAPEAVRLLQQAAIPVFRSPETCADAIAAAASQQAPIAYAGNVRSEATDQPLDTLDEAEGYALLAKHGVPAAPHAILTIGEPLPDLPFAFPVAVKVLHRDLPHKSDVGGVVLGIADALALARAVTDITASVRKVRPDVDVRHVLVQPMMRGIGEVLIGMRRDADVGPVIMLAAGGIYTELYKDSTLRLAPVDKAEAMAMISELKIGVTISGYRGRPKGDLDALADAIVAMSRLAQSADPVVWEAEVNPMLVLPAGQGVVAVDALIRTGRK
jgi:acyl-CoA synthetase (NDP forming)